MRRIGALALVWLLLAGPAGGQNTTVTMPDVPELFVALSPESATAAGVRVQSQIVLRLRLASARRFERLEVSLPDDVPGAEVLRLHRPRTREVRSYASDGFVFEAGFAIFPQRSGVLEIPPIEAVGAVAGEGGDEVRFAERWPGARIEVAGIPADWGDRWWMVADRVEIRERWSTPPEAVRQEDVLRREVTVVAHGVPAERMAPPEFAPARRVRVTEAGGLSETAVGSEGLIGTLVRAWDVEIGDAAVVDLPPVRVEWWDAAADAPARGAAPALRIEPLPADREALAAALMREAAAERRAARRVALTLLGLALAPAALLGLVWLRASLPTREDRRLRAACRAATSPLEVLRAVEVWARARGGRPDPARHPAAGRALRRLETALFGPERLGGPAEPDAPGPVPDSAAVAAAMLAAARRERLAALGRRLAAATAAVLGPRVDLPGGRAGLRDG